MMEVFHCEQGSEDWYAARLGLPTASEFATVLARTPGGKAYGKTRQTYMRKLAGEILTGEPMDNYINHHMERGHLMEGEARCLYAFLTDCEPEEVGFIKNGNAGCSPDSLIGANGMLEIKSALAHVLIEKIEADKFPAEHKAQCQGQLWIAEREWIDLAIYCPGLPLFMKRAYRDEDYIAGLAEAVDAFNRELAALVETIRHYGRREAA